MEVLSNINMNFNQIVNALFEKVSSLPTSNLFKGRLVFNIIDNCIYQYNGNKWVSLIDNSTLNSLLGELNKTNSSLQEQINNIVISSTGSGDATKEVEQARIDLNGENHDTLKSRIDTVETSVYNTNYSNSIDKYIKSLLVKKSFNSETLTFVSSSNRLSLDKVLHFGKDITISVPDGYKFAVQLWSDDSMLPSTYEKGYGWCGLSFIIPAEKYFSIVFGRVDDNELTKDDLSNITISYTSDSEYSKTSQYLNLDLFPLNKGYKNIINPEFQLGTLSESTGEEVDSNGRYRTGFIESDTQIAVKCTSSFWRRRFTYDMEGNFISVTAWAKSDIFFTIIPGYKYRYVFADENWFLPNIEKIKSQFILYTNDYTVEKDIEKMKNFINHDWDKNPFNYGFSKIINPEIVLGTLSTTTGEEVDSDNRMRTNFIESCNDITVSCPSSLYRKRFTYDLDGNLISSTEWAKSADVFRIEPGYKYRFVFAKADWSLPSRDDISELFTFYTDEVSIKKSNLIFEPEIQDCVKKLEEYCKTEKSYIFGLVTDSHYTGKNNWKDTVSTIKRINDIFPLDAVYHLGDIINGDLTKKRSSELIKIVRNDLRMCCDESYILTGNHDANDWYDKTNHTGRITSEDRYAIFGRYNDKRVNRPGNKMYHYYDIDSMKLRFIVLDSLYGEEYYGMNNDSWGFTQEQIDWVKNIALDMKYHINYHIVVLSHVPMTAEYDGYKAPIVNGEKMRKVFEDYISDGGIVVGFFHGHTHWDYIGKAKEENGIYEISTGCSMFSTSTLDNATYYPEGAIKPSRVNNTISQELWDIVVIRPDSRTVKMIRFGAGSDREFTY